jgi:type IV pilus assembly protein PilM
VFFRTPPVSIDIGSHSVKVAQLTEGRGGVRAIRFAEQSLPAGFRWEIGADRRPLVEAIRQALAKAGIRRRAAIMALPRRQVTARISAYPEAERNALRRVIEYDLADQIPFPIEQVILDFQALGPSREHPGLTDVLVVAAQRDLVREYLAVAKDLGMSVASLTVDVLALHDLTRSLPEGPPGITLTVEVGARASSINVSEGTRLRLTRSVGMGGQQLSLAIRDDLNVSMEEAERLKGTEGCALLDREPQPHRIRAWFDNFRGELRRSALSFGQAVVSRVVLLGAGSEVPGLSDAIQSEFGVQPVLLSVLQLFPHALLRGAEQHLVDHCLLAVGEALGGTGRAVWTISLVPREVAEGTRARRLRVVGAAAAVLVIAGAAFGYVSQARAVSREQGQVRVLEKRMKLAEQAQAQAKQVFDERAALTKDLQIVQSAQARRYAALELLRTISDSAPKGVILTHFLLRPGQPLQIQGTAPSSEAVADLQAALGRSRLVTTVNLDRADQVTVARSVPGARPAPSLASQQTSQPQSAKNRQVTRYGRQFPTVAGKNPAAPSRAPAPPSMVEQTAQEVSFTLTVHLWNEEQSNRSNAVASRARL